MMYDLILKANWILTTSFRKDTSLCNVVNITRHLIDLERTMGILQKQKSIFLILHFY